MYTEVFVSARGFVLSQIEPKLFFAELQVALKFELPSIFLILKNLTRLLLSPFHLTATEPNSKKAHDVFLVCSS